MTLRQAVHLFSAVWLLYCNNNEPVAWTATPRLNLPAMVLGDRLSITLYRSLAHRSCDASKWKRHTQWRRQDLLRGGANLKIRSWDTHGELQCRVQHLLVTNSFVINAVLIERAVSCWHLHQLILQTTQYLAVRIRFTPTPEWTKMKLLEVRGGTCPSAHSWRRHWTHW